VDKYSKLPLLQLPDGVCIVLRSTANQIQQSLGAIVDDLMNLEDGKNIVVGLDVEWNVDLTPGHHVHGKSAVVAVYYENRVLLLLNC
jgi:hypothetical protein